MAEINITIPDDLLARAQADTTMRGSSVDALVQTLLEGHLTRSECALPGNYELLLRVALGQMSVDTAVQQLHLESEDDLFILLTTSACRGRGSRRPTRHACVSGSMPSRKGCGERR